jgi:integrase
MHWLWTELGVKTVWSMPKSLIGKNCEELLAWSDFKPEEIVHYEGGKPPAGAKVFLMTFTRFGLSWRELLGHQPSIGAHVVDEIHLGFKSDDSNRTKELYRAMKRIPRFVPMTGTLIAGRLSTCYPTLHVIEPRYYTNFNNFLQIHQVLNPYTGKVEPGLTMHGLRHTAGKNLADAGAETRVIAAMLGHATLQMAEHYSREADRRRATTRAVKLLEDKE